jgi:hypothetical protein
MFRRYFPGDDVPRRFNGDDFDDPSPRNPNLDEFDDGVDRTRWWNKQLGATPYIAVGLGIGVVVAVVAIVVARSPQGVAPAQQNLVIQPPLAVGPPVAVLEPGAECAISNLRANNTFGGLPGLTFDYDFPRGQLHLAPCVLVAVVIGPGKEPATALLSPLTSDKGTVTIATIVGLVDLPRGSTVYIGNQIEDGPDGLPKRISNILTLE